MFALADCNNFYCSCERLFQPQYNGVPVVVLSNNDGCAIARSEEAKAIGIKMGEPFFMIRELIEKHNVKVFSSNYALYGDISRRVVNVYRLFVKEIEVYSIDESFLDLSNYINIDFQAHAEKIRNTVKQWVGVPICVGVGSSKTLAKAANRYAKKVYPKEGVFVIDTEEKREEVLSYMSVEDVWGIGRKYAAWLKDNNIVSALQLSACNEEWIRQKMGVVGVRLLKELNGISCLELEEIEGKRKVICTSRSFGTLLTKKKDIAHAVATHATRCADKMRSDGICTSVVNVFIHTHPHLVFDKQYHGTVNVVLSRPSNYTGDIVKAALNGLETIFKPDHNYLKAGVICMDMTPQESNQQSLFDTQADNSKAQKLIGVIDVINAKLGRDKLRFASAGYSDKWGLRSDHLSPCFTTNFYDLPHVNLHHV